MRTRRGSTALFFVALAMTRGPPLPVPAVRSLIPVESLVDEVEKRNKLKMLNPFLEQLVSEGSKVGSLC